ncbi:MAG TPA: DNA-directed RNA polymerase, partial [Beutenbergiaceae bacterium]|nr:DNA-directed RNA polymerase [Beutenbergiaceae bacterium]
MEKSYDKGGTSAYYVLPEEVREYLLGYEDRDVVNMFDPNYGAMVCPPDPWSKISGGGYITPRRKAAATLMPLKNIRREHIKVIREQFTAENMPMIFECANYLQSQAYEIHGPTLDLIKRVWFSGGGVLGIPQKTYRPKPEFPFAEDWDKKEASPEELELFSRWRREAQEWYYGNRQWQSRVRDVGGLIRTSSFYANRPIWFPVFMDSRGRWYYRGSPNPQGTQIAKGVLHFHEKKPLGPDGVFWLKVHIANSFGYDGTRFVDRAKWTEDNWKAIERALDRPEDFPEVWGDEDPIVMFSAAYELREAYRSGNPETYKTGVPVHLDATCSGIQHFSALLRDPVGARHVNLYDTGGETKEDIYQAVASAAYHRLLEQRTHPDEGVRRGSAPWIDLGVPRDLAKRPVMTYVYGVTLHTTRDYISDYAYEKYPDQCKSLDNNHVTTLGRALFSGIETALPATVNGMRWLHKVVREVGREKRLTWTTPTGFIVQHDYQTYEDRRVRVDSAGIDRVIVREYTDGVRLRGMVNAVSPNFIHALDSSHLTMTALACKKEGLHF